MTLQPAAPNGSPGDRRGSGHRALHLTPEAAERIRAEIARAGGREVCFLAGVGPRGEITDPRAVARGNRDAVLAAARDAAEGGVMIHNHPTGLLEPSGSDLAVAGRLYDRGLGTAITDNQASRLFVVIEPPEPRIVEPLDPEELDGVVAPGGALSRLHPAYEDREGQRRMMRVVTERYNQGGVAVVEAGTGTGKSLAYLLPAAIWAARNEERTVVSTNTINLQEQLFSQDLPLVERLTDGEVEWALVKGRANYVSIRRARLALASAGSLFEDDRTGELRAVVDWTGTTEDGSLTDLPFAPSDEVWEEVRSDSDICLRARCPHFQECHYQKSRRRAGSAKLLVVNHALLFTDVSVRRATENWSQAAVLPRYRHLILDEAHNVEDAATAHLGVEVTRRGLFRLFSRLDRKGKGVLSAIQDRLGGDPDRGTARELRRRIEERVRPAVEEARSAAGLLVELLEPLLPGTEGEAARIGEGEEAIPEPAEDPSVAERLDGFLHALARLEREVEELRRRIELDEEWGDALEGRLLDLSAAERRAGGAARALRLVLRPGEEEAAGFVRWLERRSAGRSRRVNLALAAAPVELGPLLRETIFARLETSVLTSASLATRGTFGFLRERLGLGRAAEGDGGAPAGDGGRDLDVVEEIVASPFDFRRQALFAVPTDLPDVRGGGAEFQDATARIVEELAGITGGGIFVLFTSHRALGAVAERLRKRGADGRWPLYVQGEGSRARLLEAFTASGRGVLLGTASFWEGVDVPGRPLRGLVIQKLPFRVPTEPVTAARLEAVEAAGGNPFWSYMLPLAALRLKQGFGRLIRSRSDRGAILLLDDRILTRRYGRYLRDSLPDAPMVKGPWAEVERRLAEFYGG